MDSLYIFQYPTNTARTKFTLVIFCSNANIDISYLRERLREFFETNVPPTKIYVLGSLLLRGILVDLFGSNRDEVFDVIPSYLTKHNDIAIAIFNGDGEITLLNGNNLPDGPKILHEGMVSIFNTRGGLVEAASENYHYIFPSGVHSTFFIRPGNILVKSAEIIFICIPLLRQLKRKLSAIYCDTSSINSIAYALIELKKQLDQTWQTPVVVSFGSYDGWEKFDFRDTSNCLILISVSTSGSLARKIKHKHPQVGAQAIQHIFFISEQPTDLPFLCDLTSELSKRNLKMQPSESACSLCHTGSHAVRISGDILTMERPKVNPIVLTKNDRPGWLSQFMQKFHANNGVDLIRCYYGEEIKKRFELYLKTEEVLSNMKAKSSDGFFRKNFTQKLDNFSHQAIPANVKLVVHLEDEGSKILAQQVHDQLPKTVKLVSSKNLSTLDMPQSVSGAVLVVCSCLATGNSVLYINKYLRRFGTLSKTFFVLFARSENDDLFNFIKSNITQGDYGPATNQMFVVEKLNCPYQIEFPEEQKNLSWSQEIDLISDLIETSEADSSIQSATPFLRERLSILHNATDSKVGGLTNEVFLRNPTSKSRMSINKNFAFFDFDGYHDKVSQADIYFTISAVLNNLRVPGNTSKRIIQEEHVRTVLHPVNFNRFDDGIIQSALLRTARPAELNYQLDRDLSLELMGIVIKMIDNHTDQHGSEALIEFLFAFATKRLKVLDLHLLQILKRGEQIENSVLKAFLILIKRKVLTSVV
jgi:hypothetical protein